MPRRIKASPVVALSVGIGWSHRLRLSGLTGPAADIANEILVLRHQFNVLQQAAPRRQLRRLSSSTRGLAATPTPEIQ
jgi:hypothetical protein